MASLSSLGAGSADVWTRGPALELLTAAQIWSRLYDGSWQRPFPGVYTDGGYVLSPLQWAWTAVLASGGDRRPHALAEDAPLCRLVAVACGRTAARVWGLPLIDDDDPATGARDRHNHDVAVWRHLRQLRSTQPGLEEVLHRHELHLDRTDVVRHPSGLWLTAAARTLLDLSPLLSCEALVCAIDAARHRGLVQPTELAAVATGSGLRQAATFRAAVALSDDGAESPAETLTRLLLKPDLPGLRTQVRLADTHGRLIARFDLGDEDLKLAVEADGKRGHAGDAMAAKDRRRDAKTTPYGWWTERATWFELRRQQESFRLRVLGVAAQRRRPAA